MVFGAGFVLGPIRVLWIEPRLGTRTAELIEMPLMLIVLILSARWTVRRFQLITVSARVAAGLIALTLLVLTEVTLVLWLRGLSLQQYLTVRDPVSGIAYLVMLTVFAAMPAFVRAR
jgi:hypothetical protein